MEACVCGGGLVVHGGGRDMRRHHVRHHIYVV